MKFDWRMGKMKKERNPKINQLLTAVIELIEEGMDIHTMKVIDITNRAGIGKGTAYEYFKCKEELVVAALVWDMKGQIEKLREELLAAGDFKSQVLIVFGWMDNNKDRKRSGTQFFKMAGQSYEIASGVRREFEHMAEEKSCLFDELLGIMQNQGIKEGIIDGRQETALIHMILISNFITYFLYSAQDYELISMDSMGIKEFLYGNLQKCLGGKA